MTAEEIKGNRYLIDANGKPMRPEDAQFANQKEMVDAMSDPRYTTDVEFRSLVAFMVGNSPTTSAPTTGRQLAHAMADVPSLKKAQLEEVFKEQTVKLFGNPLYETSPTYRMEVEEWIKANDPALTAAMGKSVIDRTAAKQQGVVRVQLGENKDAVREMQGELRQGKIDKATAAAAERRAAIDKSLADEIEELNSTAKPDHDDYSPA